MSFLAAEFSFVKTLQPRIGDFRGVISARAGCLVNDFRFPRARENFLETRL